MTSALTNDVPVVALQTKFSHCRKFFEKTLGVSQKRLHMFCQTPDNIRPGSSWNVLGSVAVVRCWRPPVTGRLSHCIPARLHTKTKAN